MKKLALFTLLSLLAVSIHAAIDHSEQLSVRQTFTQSSDVSLSQISPSYKISISGQCQLNHNGQASLFRAIMVDENGEEYLVAEFNDFISTGQQVDFTDACAETEFSSKVKPAKLKIILVNAQATIDNVTYDSSESATRGTSDIAAAKNTRVANEISLYNQAIQREGLLWIAGETSLSNLSYSQKKKIFGATSDSCCWYGLEHYKGGIFCTPSYLANRERSNTPSQYVPNFTWQRRHGINWNTPVKNQSVPGELHGTYMQNDSIGAGTCWAFASIALAETYANIYYNQKIDLNLSEQDLISCSNAGTVNGGYTQPALTYIINTGVVNEDCFEYTASMQNCSEKCSNAQIILSGGTLLSIDLGTSLIETIKQAIINYGPICTSIASVPPYSFPSHAMLLVGYGTINAGDTITFYNPTSTPIIIDNNSQYIGDTYFIFKNSWGINSGVDGYLYFFFENSRMMTNRYTIYNNINVSGYTTNDIICEDLDGDGYYNWGIGPKPSYCPPCPDQPDGNDRNPNVGGMNSFGVSIYLGDSNAAPCIVGDDAIGCDGKFAVMNIDESVEVEWTVEGATTNNVPLVIQGTNKEALVIVKQGHYNDIQGYHLFTGNATIRATFVSNSTPMSLTKTIYVSGDLAPFVNTQNTTIPKIGVNRTFTELHCTNIPSQYIKWDVTVPGVGHYTQYGHSITVRPMSAGILSVTITNLSACDTATATYSFSYNIVGGQIILANNPANTYLEYEIEMETSDSRSSCSIEVFNSNGLIMETQPLRSTDGTKIINTSSYTDGYYTIRLLNNGELIDTKNFIVKH